MEFLHNVRRRLGLATYSRGHVESTSNIIDETATPADYSSGDLVEDEFYMLDINDRQSNIDRM